MTKPFLLALIPVLFLSCSSSRKNNDDNDMGKSSRAEEFYHNFSYLHSSINKQKDKPIGKCSSKKQADKIIKKLLSDLQGDKIDRSIIKANIGFCYYYQKQKIKSIYYLNGSLQESKDDILSSIVLNGLGVLYSDFARFDIAESYFTQSIEKNPTVINRINLANLYYKGKSREKLKEKLGALDAESDEYGSPTYYLLLGGHHFLLGNYSDSVENYQRALSKMKNRSSSMAHYAIALYRTNREEYDSFLEENKDLLEGNPYFSFLLKEVKNEN
jgi:tetratricopeptide (TPR) repeat protein